MSRLLVLILSHLYVDVLSLLIPAPEVVPGRDSARQLLRLDFRVAAVPIGESLGRRSGAHCVEFLS